MIPARFTSRLRRGRQRSAFWAEERLVGACPMILLRNKAYARRRLSGILWSASDATGVASLRFYRELLHHASLMYRPERQLRRLLRFLLQLERVTRNVVKHLPWWSSPFSSTGFAHSITRPRKRGAPSEPISLPRAQPPGCACRLQASAHRAGVRK
jgi:hypothetical protein